MKKYLGLVMGAILSLALVGTANAKHDTTTAGDFAGGISASRHNLSTSGSHLNGWSDGTRGANGVGGITGTTSDRALQTSGTSEMCAICHTPHFTDRGTGPLWNRVAERRSGISTYGNTIAENFDGGANLFSTLACLTCHDGTTTFDSLINKPGKGRGGSTWTFNDNNIHGIAQFITTTRLNIGDANGSSTGSQVVDLRNDHPIGVVYRGQGDAGASASLRSTSTVLSSINLNIAAEGATDLDALVKGNLWAVKGFISNTATIANLLRSGDGSASDDSRQYVQCASCHDLHYKNLTNPDADFVATYGPTDNNHESDKIDGLFMRRVGGNSDSGLCRTCHAK